MIRSGCGVVLLLLLGGCVGGATPAEVATYEAIAPDYSAYVQADPELSAEERERRMRTVESWRLRVGAAK